MSEPQVHHWDKGRVEAFSDGVFAIAITLLVLDIGIDPREFGDIWGALGDEWPSYVAFATSFLTIGGVWISHHESFTRLRFVDPGLLRINLLLLMVVSFLPFPTALMADALEAARGAERAAIIVYGATAIAIELISVWMRRYAEARPYLLPQEEQPPPDPTVRHVRKVAGVPIVWAITIAIGVIFFPKVAAVMYLIVAAQGVFQLGRGRPPAHAAQPG